MQGAGNEISQRPGAQGADVHGSDGNPHGRGFPADVEPQLLLPLQPGTASVRVEMEGEDSGDVAIIHERFRESSSRQQHHVAEDGEPQGAVDQQAEMAQDMNGEARKPRKPVPEITAAVSMAGPA